MANYRYTKDLVDDVLFRGGEAVDGTSDFHAKALEYVNRAYQAVWMGGSEIDPTINEEWWWLRNSGSLFMAPAVKGSVTVAQGSSAITFGSAPMSSLTGWHFKKADGRNTVYKILAHTGGSPSATLDANYLEASGTVTGIAFKTDMDLGGAIGGAANLLKVVSPMYSHRAHERGHEVDGIDLAAMTRTYPVAEIEAGVPTKFAHLSESEVRFNRYRADTDTDLRVDFWYLRRPADLTYSTSEEPLLPMSYRRLLADIAAYWLFMDKNDDRADAAILAAKALLKAMQKEHRYRIVRQGNLGQIYPRAPSGVRGGVRRTESGSIIG